MSEGEGEQPGSAGTPPNRPEGELPAEPEKAALLMSALERQQRKMPRLRAALAADTSDEEAVSREIRNLARMPIGEDELLALLFPEPVGDTKLAKRPTTPLRRQVIVWRHELTRWWKHKNPAIRIVYGTSWLALLATTTFASVLPWWVAYPLAAVVIGIKMKSRLGELDPDHMRDLKRTHMARQLQLWELINIAQQWIGSPPSTRERNDYRDKVLALIVSYMRDHSADPKKRTIFVNLVEHVGGNVVSVIARSDANRPLPTFYQAEQCSLVWEAMKTGVAQVTGDVYTDAPLTPAGKRYHSVMALPVKFGGKTGEVVGVVSIDSEQKFHFDRHFDRLKEELSPYVQLLAVAMTLDHGKTRNAQLPEGTSSGGEEANDDPDDP
ncbi:MAG: GAF domain-containing protein [Kofleriaceae bacterium]